MNLSKKFCLLVKMNRALGCIFLILCSAKTLSASTAQQDHAAQDNMRPMSISLMTIKSAEYWVFEGNIPFRYPDDVVKGFYPPEIASPSIDCAEQGFAQIVAYLKANPEELKQALANGVTRAIVLSINDYALAAIDRTPRSPKLSHWGLDRDLSRGYWRWEVTLTRDGDCMLPRILAIRETFRSVTRLDPKHPKG